MSAARFIGVMPERRTQRRQWPKNVRPSSASASVQKSQKASFMAHARAVMRRAPFTLANST
jgi:cob(I)alamin adenosyltransferase